MQGNTTSAYRKHGLTCDECTVRYTAVAVVIMYIVHLAADSPGRDPSVISTSSHRSQSALGGSESGHKALVLKVQYTSYSHH